ncbi:MAG: NrfD/PsrC family molybdoenzyme membrane anchor subunit [Pseudomonadota bacterium]
MDPTLVYNIQSGPIWDWRVAVDLFAGGVGVGAFLFAIILARLGDQRYQRLAQTAAVIAPFLVMLGLLFLFWKIGNKFNVYQMAINLAPTSLMWWGFLIQSALVVLGLVHAWLWLDRASNATRDALGLLVGLLALLVGIYHGLLLAVLTSHPLWATGSIVLMAILAFASTGVAGVLLTHLIRTLVTGRGEEEVDLAEYVNGLRPVRNILGTTLVLMLVNFFLWWVDLSFGSLQSKQALEGALSAYGPMFMQMGIGLGLIVPLILIVWFFGKAPIKNPARTLSVIGLASLLVLVGGFVIRYAVVMGGQVPLPISTL